MIRRRNKFFKVRRRYKLTRKAWLWAGLITMIAVFVGTSVYIGMHFYDVFMQRRIETNIRDIFEAAKQEHGGVNLPEDSENFERIRGESEWARERRLLLEAEERGKIIWAELLEMNPDFRGMIEIPGLIPSQPYVHSKVSGGADYLNTDFHGKRNRHGTVYLSSLNGRLLMDNNSIFFGHHLETGGMFARLMQYKNAETFKKAPVIILDSLMGEFTYIIFSAHVSEPEHWYTSPIIGKQEYADYVEELQARSLFITDVEVTADDRVITLSVCDYTYEDMRFLVHARRLRPGEEVPTEVIAEPNLNRKDFEVSNLQPLGEINLKSTAVAQNPTNGRMFYYQMQAGMIHRYSGNTAEAQGPFRALSRSGVTVNSFAAAHIVNIRNEEDESSRALYLAIEGVGGHTGVINLYSAGLAQGMIRLEGRISPEGVNARYPALQGSEGGIIWLLYTVPGEESSHIYRVALQGHRVAGEPEFLFTVPGVTDARPVGFNYIDGEMLVIWHEAANGFLRAAKPASGAIYSLNDEIGERARVMPYGDVSGHILRLAVERFGRVFFTSVNITELHPVTVTKSPGGSSCIHECDEDCEEACLHECDENCISEPSGNTDGDQGDDPIGGDGGGDGSADSTDPGDPDPPE